MPAMPVRWDREELLVRYPTSLPEARVRTLIVELFETGEIPPRRPNGRYHLDIRTWGGFVEIEEQCYRVIVVRDEVTIEAVA